MARRFCRAEGCLDFVVGWTAGWTAGVGMGEVPDGGARTDARRERARNAPDTGESWTPKPSLQKLKEFQATQAKLQAEQKAAGYVHLIGNKIGGVHITSQIIPACFMVAGAAMLAKGYYHLYTGTGKL